MLRVVVVSSVVVVVEWSFKVGEALMVGWGSVICEQKHTDVVWRDKTVLKSFKKN